jgi:hypothetical protein
MEAFLHEGGEGAEAAGVKGEKAELAELVVGYGDIKTPAAGMKVTGDTATLPSARRRSASRRSAAAGSTTRTTSCQREAGSEARGGARGYTGRAPFGARANRSAPSAEAIEQCRTIGGRRRRDLDGPPIDRVRERELERVQRLALEGDGIAAGRPAAAVAAIADQRMAAQLGLHADLSLPAGRQPHFQRATSTRRPRRRGSR